MSRIHSQPNIVVAAAAAMALVMSLLVVGPDTPASGQGAAVTGLVEGGAGPLEGYEVTLYATNGTAAPSALGMATSGVDGAFDIAYTSPAAADSVLYLLARSGALTTDPDVVTLASVLGPEPVAPAHVISPQTTVGTAFAMAQFTDDGEISGASPGLQNAAGMAHNLFDPVTGGPGSVLTNLVNTGTETLSNFNSLANMVTACVSTNLECAGFLTAATPAGAPAPTDTFDALGDIVRNPSNNAAALHTISLLPPAPYSPARVVAPAAWTLALRFDGDGTTMSGPGNFAIDDKGNLWVANNYTWSPGTAGPACRSKLLLEFTPTGEFVAGSPYTGGGVSGAGYGITIDPYGDIWVGNFGFASTNCTEYTPHDSISQFRPDGTPVSPDATGTGAGETGGYVVGGIDWPQGTVSDRKGNIWVANCNGDSVTLLPDGDPARATELADIGLKKPFDIAFDLAGNAYVTGTASDNVAVLAPDGTALPLSPLDGGMFKRPMGIAANSDGEMWVSNSRLIDLPCPLTDVINEGEPSLTFIADDGTLAEYTGGGLTVPWGIVVDGYDNVWVSNFAEKRVSVFCGRDNSPYCPDGAIRGNPISPAGTGYLFDGLTRSTAVDIDLSGNLWVSNNWKEAPVQTNPGGYQIVAFVGVAGPVIPPTPIPRPTPPPTPPAPPATPIPTAPNFTG